MKVRNFLRSSVQKVAQLAESLELRGFQSVLTPKTEEALRNFLRTSKK